MAEKAKYWVAVLYPESMVDNWEEKISGLVEVPFAYCIHDKDLDKEEEDRKIHVHMILAFPNTTTYKHALSVFQEVQKSCATCKRVINIRRMYEYLIHNTDDSRNKYQYDVFERVVGNNFDIGSYEQIGVEEKHKMLDELLDFIIANKYCNMIDFRIALVSQFDSSYTSLIFGYHSLFESFCRGNYLKYKDSDN